MMGLDLLTRLDPLRRVRCPYCFHEAAAFRLHVRCTSAACRRDFARQVEDPILTRALNGQAAAAPALRSPWWADPLADPGRGPRRFLDVLVLPDAVDCPMCGEPAAQRLCPACHHELPDLAITRARPGSITIFGPQAVGKTTFMTVLLQEIRKAPGESRRLGLKPLDDDVRLRYRHEYYEVTYGARDQGIGAGGAPVRSRHAPTLSLEIDRRVLQPLVYELKTARPRRGVPLVSFADLAGEDWEMKSELLRREGGHLVRGSGGLLFLIDPLRIPDVAARLDLTEEEAHVPPADYVEDVDTLASFFPRTPVRTPLAICLNKIDRWGHLLAPGSTLHRVASSVLDTADPHALDGVVHDEVRSALRQWGQEEFLDRLESDFPRHRFFACSALGDAARIRPEESPPAPTPLLVERAALWLLAQQGLTA